MRYGVSRSSARVSGNERTERETERRVEKKNGGFVQIFIGREHILHTYCTHAHTGTWGFVSDEILWREQAAADHLRHNNILVCRPIFLRSSLDSETIRSFLGGISCKK